jgi:poly(3-hydroxybutyrate) depolymerase
MIAAAVPRHGEADRRRDIHLHDTGFKFVAHWSLPPECSIAHNPRPIALPPADPSVAQQAQPGFFLYCLKTKLQAPAGTVFPDPSSRLVNPVHGVHIWVVMAISSTVITPSAHDASSPDAGRRRRRRRTGDACRTAAVVFLCAWYAGAAPPTFRPGEETTVFWKPVNREIPLYVPSDYTPGRKWPVVFFYHGLNGQPSTAFIRELTAGKRVIVVGMEYLERGLRRRTAAENMRYLERELAQLEALRKSLAGRLVIDKQHLYAAGVSKGGWQVSRFVDRGLPGLAGAMIVLAGRFPGRTAATPDLHGKPVYIGAGERDGNNRYARMAAQFFARNGAAITWEEFADRGHQVDPGAPRLRAWAEAVLVRSPKENRSAAREWLREQQKRYAKLESETKQAVFLAGLTADPRFRWCPRRSRNAIQSDLAALRRNGPAAACRDAEALFAKALWKEQTARRLRDLKQALQYYRQCAEKYRDTAAGKRARKAADEVAEQVAESEMRLRHTPPGVPRIRRH